MNTRQQSRLKKIEQDIKNIDINYRIALLKKVKQIKNEKNEKKCIDLLTELESEIALTKRQLNADLGFDKLKIETKNIVNQSEANDVRDKVNELANLQSLLIKKNNAAKWYSPISNFFSKCNPFSNCCEAEREKEPVTHSTGRGYHSINTQ